MTLKCIAGIEKPDSGRIVLNGKILFDSEKHINLSTQKRKVGYLFQNYALFPNMTVRENISVGLAASKENSNSRLEELAALISAGRSGEPISLAAFRWPAAESCAGEKPGL